MNLNGKYIIVNNNLKQIVTFLDNNGYEWAKNKFDVYDTYKYIKNVFYENNDVIYIRFLSNIEYWISRDEPGKDYEYMNIKSLSREYKLKRILK